MNSISITWNGHSCFTVEKDGFSIVFDPYGPNTVPGLAPLSLTATWYSAATSTVTTDTRTQ